MWEKVTLSPAFCGHWSLTSRSLSGTLFSICFVSFIELPWETYGEKGEGGMTGRFRAFLHLVPPDTIKRTLLFPNFLLHCQRAGK